MSVVYSADWEWELPERIKALIQEERGSRNEGHRLEVRLKNYVMSRFMEIYRRLGVLEES